MFHPVPARWLAALPAIAASLAVAQPAPVPPAPRSAEPVPPTLEFRSALEAYQPFTDEKAIPWKEANETVYRRGGWRAYAKEAAEKAPAEGDLPKVGTDPHAGHSMPMPKKDRP